MKTITKSFLVALFLTCSSYSVFAQEGAEKEWTFLLFLNGHNSLSSFSDSNIIDMEKSGSTDQVNYVVQWGKMGEVNTKRLLVQKSVDSSKVTSPTVMDLKDNDMGDYHSLVDFVRWGVEKYPARHYFIAVWDHGSGWKTYGAKNGFHATDISLDDNTGHKITTEELGLALAESKKIIGHNIDIYGSDACLMQMIEVATEMKDSINYFVGSQELEPGEGWPYSPFFAKWGALPTQTPAEIAVLLSKEYFAAYNGGVYGSGRNVTFSALDMSKLDAVISSSMQLSQHLKSLGSDALKSIKNEVTTVQGFYYSDYIDYGDFLKKVESLPVQKDHRVIARAQADLYSLVLSTNNSPLYSRATGLSIWIPTTETSDMARYSGLQFSKLSGWDTFLQLLFKP